MLCGKGFQLNLPDNGQSVKYFGPSNLMLSWVQHQASCGVTGSRLGTQLRISGKKVFKAGARKDLFPFGDALKIKPETHCYFLGQIFFKHWLRKTSAVWRMPWSWRKIHHHTLSPAKGLRKWPNIHLMQNSVQNLWTGELLPPPKRKQGFVPVIQMKGC